MPTGMRPLRRAPPYPFLRGLFMTRTSSLAALAFLSALLVLAALTLPSCAEDDAGQDDNLPTLPVVSGCTPRCGSDQLCVREQGESVCRTKNCGESVCAAAAVCEAGACVFPERTCDPACAAGQTCVYGNCITSWTPTNVCDPLLECRRACGTDTRCLAACDRSQSTACSSCRSTITRCEGRQSPACTANAIDCCVAEYCSCFPGSDECSGRPCDGCWNRYQDDQAGLERCVQQNALCADCLSPYFDCLDGGGTEASCQSLLCNCLTTCPP